MSDLSELKLTDGDVARSGVVAAPDKLTGTAAQNKALFDRLVREAVKEKFNAMVDALEASLAWEPYDAEKDYVPDNKVVYNGSSYLCLDACKGVLPTNTDYWRLIAAKGRDGTGAGDMTKDVYDPRGVEGDIFTYVDERTDTYTKAQTLSAETKTALGLASAAVPDDAFNTIMFPMLTVATVVGASVIAVQDDIRTPSATADANGIATLYLPRYGEWEITASKDGALDSGTVDVDTVTKYTITLTGLRKPLPPEYTKLEYVGFTGTQWIDTQFVPDKDYNLNFKFKYTNTDTTFYLYGVQSEAGAGSYFALGYYGSGQNTARATFPKHWADFSVNSLMKDTVCDCSVIWDGNIPKPYVNGNLSWSTDGAGNLDYPISTIYIGAQNKRSGGQSTAQGNFFKGDYYSFSVQDKDTGAYVVDIVAAKRKSDDAIGMFDCQNGLWLPNSGSGTLTAGPEVA